MQTVKYVFVALFFVHSWSWAVELKDGYYLGHSEVRGELKLIGKEGLVPLKSGRLNLSVDFAGPTNLFAMLSGDKVLTLRNENNYFNFILPVNSWYNRDLIEVSSEDSGQPVTAFFRQGYELIKSEEFDTVEFCTVGIRDIRVREDRMLRFLFIVLQSVDGAGEMLIKTHPQSYNSRQVIYREEECRRLK